MAFGHSFLVNRALKPAREALGESLGEKLADLRGAHGSDRDRIVRRTRAAVVVGGALATSALLADPTGAGASAAYDAVS